MAGAVGSRSTGQIAQWVFSSDPEAMSNLPKSLRAALASVCPGASDPRARRCGGKLLVQVADGDAVECVAMERPWGSRSASPANWAAVGCRFCASRRHGLKRNLAGERSRGRCWRLFSGGPTARCVHGNGRAAPEPGGCSARYAFSAMARPTASPSGHHPLDGRLGEGHRASGASGRRVSWPCLSRGGPRASGDAHTAPAGPLPAVAAASVRGSDGRRVTYEYTLLAGVNDGTEPGLNWRS